MPTTLSHVLEALAAVAALSGLLVISSLRRRRMGLALAAGWTGALVLFAVAGAINPASQLYGHAIWQVPSDARQVALTFDDGPNPTYTPQVLDLLARHHARATFFVLGKRAERYPDLIRRMLAEGHQVGNHTYSHRDLLVASPATIQREMEQGSRAIWSAGGSWPTLFRPPYGFRTPLVFREARRLGMRVVAWTISSQDWSRQSPSRMAQRVLVSLSPGQIVLCHDGAGDRSRMVAALEQMLAGMEAKGYQCVVISQLLSNDLSEKRMKPSREKISLNLMALERGKSPSQSGNAIGGEQCLD